MRSVRRKITLQLIPLLDLMLIVVFAQHLEVRVKSRSESHAFQQQVVETRRVAEHQSRLRNAAAVERDALQEKVQSLEQRNAQLTRLAGREKEDLEESLDRSQKSLEEMGRVMGSLFRVPPERLERLLEGRPEDAAAIRRELEAYRNRSPGAIVKHLLTFSELQKRLEVWDLHIASDNSITLRAGSEVRRLAAKSADAFVAELLRVSHTLPQPKAIVLLILSWSDASFHVRAATSEGLSKAAKRLEAEYNRRTRFDYVLLRYIPLGEPAKK